MTEGESKFVIETFLKSAHVTLSEKNSVDDEVILPLRDEEYKKIVEVFDEVVEIGKTRGIKVSKPDSQKCLNLYGNTKAISICRINN